MNGTQRKFFKNEDIEVITPTEKFITQVTEIKDLKGESQELANTNHELWVKFSVEPKNWEYGLIRTVGIKNGVNETSKCACSS